jgi:hypothetical protein
MNRFSRSLFCLICLLCFLCLSCDSFERNAYRTLKVAKVEYELLQEHAARAYLDARITQAQWDRFALAGNRFIAAHTLAADLMKTYQQSRTAGSTDSDAIRARVNAVLADLPALLADLRSLLASFEPRTDAPRAPAGSSSPGEQR